MTKADSIFKENIRKILHEGVFSENARPRYKNGKVANSKYITGSFAEYDLSKENSLSQRFVRLLSNQRLKKSSGFIKINPIA